MCMCVYASVETVAWCMWWEFIKMGVHWNLFMDMDIYNLITGIIYTLLVVKIRLEGPLLDNLCQS